MDFREVLWLLKNTRNSQHGPLDTPNRSYLVRQSQQIKTIISSDIFLAYIGRLLNATHHHYILTILTYPLTKTKLFYGSKSRLFHFHLLIPRSISTILGEMILLTINEFFVFPEKSSLFGKLFRKTLINILA